LIRFKLSLMMFLEFFIWGAWLPLIFGYLPSLGFNELEQAFVTGAFNLAAFTAMFFGTQFVDRKFAAEKFLAFSHLIGGAAIMGLFWIRQGWSVSVFGRDVDVTFCAFFSLMLLHSLFYVPTISITNSIAFANLRDPQHEFGPVRVWGTIGWIAAAWPFVFILIDWQRVPTFGSVPNLEWLSTALGSGLKDAALRESTRYIFLVAGIASLVLALFSLALPHTPPRPAQLTGEKFAWLEAMKLLRVPFIFVLFIVTFFDAAVHQCYFFWTPRFLESTSVAIPGNWVTPIMSIGQVAEIGTMVFLGFTLKKLGWRYTMAIGILGHAVRFSVFAFVPAPIPAIVVNLLHGICYAFFFATVYIFVDEFFPKDARSSAQGLFNFLILGLGPFASNFLWVYLGKAYAIPGGVDFQKLFIVPAAIGLGAALLLFLFFHPPQSAVSGGLPPKIEDALARDDVWAPPPSEAIEERRDGIREK
jgi:MFS family permease